MLKKLRTAGGNKVKSVPWGGFVQIGSGVWCILTILSECVLSALKITTMIRAENIHKSYGSVEVLKGVSLEIGKGEIVSIVGASGAGKTTLLQILGTLDLPSSGQACHIEINGEEITNLKEKQLAKFRNEHIGFIFQFHQLLPEFTALENVCIPAFIKDTDKGEAEKLAAELMEFLGLGHRLHHKPAALSGGEQQRVAVARALINQPAVVLADEPSGNLDSASADRLHNLFFKLRERYGQTFVIVTHNEELAAMADRKLTMVDGRIVDENGD
jgi:lipoprotein-releasing system ATP-binding protein